MSEPLITTILPTYQRPLLLKRAIRSVQNQTFSNFKLCVYDNASNDDTEKVVRSLAEKDSRIEYYRHPQNIGSVGNYLFASKRIQTPFFSMFADDDVLLPEFYETAYTSLKENPEAGFFVGLTVTCTEDGRVVKVPLENWPHEGLYYPDESFIRIQSNLPIWTGILFRREVLEKIGPLDSIVNSTIDLDFLTHASAHFPLILSKKKCAIFLSHGSSTTGSGFGMMAEESRTALTKNISNMPTLSLAMKEQAYDYFKKTQKSNLATGLKHCLKVRNFQYFDQLLSQSSCLSPKTRRLFLLRRFIAKYISFLLKPWTYYKKMRKTIKRRFKKCPPTLLEDLANKYGEYAKWLTFGEEV